MTTLPTTFDIVHRTSLAGRTAITRTWSDLPLSAATRSFLTATVSDQLWAHQHEAIGSLLAGEDVALTTLTASGKTLVFHAAAIEALAKDPHARVLAIYPMKALGNEQEQRWREALAEAGIDGVVARLDGSVRGTAERLDACKRARVIAATPDVLHTWMLARLGHTGFDAIAKFVRNLAVVVVDEAHTYTGVFGSNAAFLYRRLQHACGVLGARPQFIAASATLEDSHSHLRRLIGRQFTVVGTDRDGSPRQTLDVIMARPDPGSDYHSQLVELIGALAKQDRRFIAFFDSRRAAEQMASIVGRKTDQEDEKDVSDMVDHLEQARVLPYRAGYESTHRARIEERLRSGSLRGVLSTSALELGIDIPGLDVVVLIGVPPSAASLHQRIGRIGRKGPGTVIVVHTGSPEDELAFAQPERLLERPPLPSSLCLDSKRIQYIHAMALARQGGEHEHATRLAGAVETPFDEAHVSWPTGFVELCHEERSGRVPPALRDMKREGGEMPTLAFMLRDVEPQYDVLMPSGRERQRLGTLSWSQVMREAYPGAVYYYAGRSHRVTHVDTRAHEVRVAPCKRYTTQPMPTLMRISPQTTIHRRVRHDDLEAIECDLMVYESVLGFRERRGSQQAQVSYPCTAPVNYARPNFARSYFTTGVCLFHGALDLLTAADASLLGTLLQRAFVSLWPVDAQDLGATDAKLRAAWAGLDGDRRFIALFDRTYGSLRLSGRSLDDDHLLALLTTASRMASQGEVTIRGEHHVISDALTRALNALQLAATAPAQVLTAGDVDVADVDSVPVLLPQSYATTSERPGESFEVHSVFLHPTRGVCYRGVWIAANGGRELDTVTVDSMLGIEGRCKPGRYDVNTGLPVAA